MDNQRRRVILWFSLVLIIVAIIVSTVACREALKGLAPREGVFNLVIENQTTQVLTIFIDDELVGKVKPGATISQPNPSQVSEYLVVAKNEQGETVFSKTLTRQQMQHVKGTDTFTVVIPSLEKGLESSENVTGK